MVLVLGVVLHPTKKRTCKGYIRGFQEEEDMCEDINNPNFEFKFDRKQEETAIHCEVCGGQINLEDTWSFHKVYWRCYNRDLYTHNDCF